MNAPSDYPLPNGMRLCVARGDLTAWKADAIVNAANQRMLGGGGVDGAIHRVAGPALLEACREVPEVRPGVRCPTGEARLTLAYGGLAAKAVIHTVGPRYRSAAHSEPLLASAYRQSLAVAVAEGFESVAFPAVSCGVYGYPLREGARVAVSVCREVATSSQAKPALRRIDFVLFSDDAFDAWDQAARALLLSPMDSRLSS